MLLESNSVYVYQYYQRITKIRVYRNIHIHTERERARERNIDIYIIIIISIYIEREKERKKKARERERGYLGPTFYDPQWIAEVLAFHFRITPRLCLSISSIGRGLNTNVF